MRLLGVALLFGLLTVLTQIGGVVYLVARWLSRKAKITGLAARLAIFVTLYVSATAATPFLAPAFGRIALSCFERGSLQVQSPLYCILNRNYLTPVAKRAAEALSVAMEQKHPGTVTLVLDANFPFLGGFPLLPHLSHNDGRKLDVAFYYRDEAGGVLNRVTRSPIGYFAFEEPVADAVLPCRGRTDLLTLRWDMGFLQGLFPAWTLDEVRTGAALRWLASEGQEFGVERIFIEPHLSQRLGVSGQNLGFQGCRAARHDDHIHFQVRE
ncbi:hypothetical protein GR138_05195 [Shinella kummerowiae]|jgi:hypothetical protein|uniref:Uncharacterized protein n=1 Tax=Shinella kummerowiae TaxID=417745 RepID=A0A6N8S838_9HYPH|nr:hypothetical protein [Shinella kummerowiae]MXN44577.1 hypothetical protein [Shinella kummerowiae]